MIISIAPAVPRWRRRAVVVLASAALTALLAPLLDDEAAPSSAVVALPVAATQTDVARSATVDAAPQSAVGGEAPRRVAASVPAAVAPTSPLPTFPFRFLGRLDVDGVSSAVLYGRGRTVTVRGPAPLDDEYVVDAMEEGHVMLRHVPSGTSRVLELATPQRTVIAAGAAPETAKD